MIAIVNVSKEVKPFGWQDYELRINSKVIAKFAHRREDGLTKCLQLAANASEKAKWDNIANIFSIIQNDSH